jgi:hypothetical protein
MPFVSSLFRLGLVALILALPAAARASSVAVDGDKLVYTAQQGEDNDLTIDETWDGSYTMYYRVVDRVPIAPGAGCSPSPDNLSTVLCSTAPHQIDVDLGDHDDRASVIGWYGIRVDGGEDDDRITCHTNGNCDVHGGAGEDSLVAEGPGALDGGPGDDVLSVNVFAPDPISVQLTGGDGNDELHGGPAGDRLDGGPGNDLIVGDPFGHSGADTLDGGPGDDELNGGLGPDRLSGGDGRDTLDYSYRSAAVAVTLPGTSSSGDEGDVLAPDFENVVGTRYADTLIGDAGPNELTGGDGNDTLAGGGGPDSIVGGTGDDNLDGGAGQDVYQGNEGNDTIDAREPADGPVVGAESVFCGTGSDSAQVDADDLTDRCETVAVTGRPHESPAPGSPPTDPPQDPSSAELDIDLVEPSVVADDGMLKFKVRCDRSDHASCAGVAGASVKRGPRLSSKSFVARSGHKTVIRAKLSRSARKLIRRKKRVVAVASIVVKVKGQPPVTWSRRITIRKGAL